MLLDTARWPAIGASGRAAVHRVEGAFGRGILRHYRRGGLIARFSRDLYLWIGEDATRAFREFRLLAELRRRDLPVPAPLAAGYRRRGAFYCADLLTEELSQTRTLAAALPDLAAQPALWQQLGTTLARFHAAGVWHADLNAHNLLLDASQRWWLIDFDRGRLLQPASSWAHSRLARLHRSLLKVGAAALPGWSDGWHGLRQAHDAALQRHISP